MANWKVKRGFHSEISPRKPRLLRSLKNIQIKEIDLPFVPIFLVQNVALALLRPRKRQSVLFHMLQVFNDGNFIESCIQQVRQCLREWWVCQLERRQQRQERWVSFSGVVAPSRAFTGILARSHRDIAEIMSTGQKSKRQSIMPTLEKSCRCSVLS